MKAIRFVVPFLVLMAGAILPAKAEIKIGYVSTDRILSEAAPALRAQKRLEKEFEKRQQELSRKGDAIEAMRKALAGSSSAPGSSQREAEQKRLKDANDELKQLNAEFRESLSKRRNEELSKVVEAANMAIKQLAQSEKFTFIIQEAVYADPSHDITGRIIKALGD